MINLWDGFIPDKPGCQRGEQEKLKWQKHGKEKVVKICYSSIYQPIYLSMLISKTKTAIRIDLTAAASLHSILLPGFVKLD